MASLAETVPVIQERHKWSLVVAGAERRSHGAANEARLRSKKGEAKLEGEAGERRGPGRQGGGEAT